MLATEIWGIVKVGQNMHGEELAGNREGFSEEREGMQILVEPWSSEDAFKPTRLISLERFKFTFLQPCKDPFVEKPTD